MASEDLFLEGFNEDLQPSSEPVEVKETPQVETQPVDERVTFVDEISKQLDLTPNEYMDAYKESLQQQELYELMDEGLSEEMALEVLETRQFKAQQQAEIQARQQQEEQAQNKEFHDLLNLFREINGRDFNPDKDTIPQNVWEANAKGLSLKEAYREHDQDAAFLDGLMGDL